MSTPEHDAPVITKLPEADARGFVRIEGREYLELTENGWGALIAAAADSERVRRTPLHPGDYRVHTIQERDGATETSQEPRTHEDQRDIDDAIDEHLAEAGLEPRPRGYRWFLQTPPGTDDATAFWRHLNRTFADLASSAPDPAEAFQALQAIIRSLYGGEDGAT
ncbi:DUF5956 family protein [Glycomyces sp. MUSA5-2]|uniref:DUF5956 family protein n=1 Tax=Glycomyces sp. MUSA5-2 TaxID=2053002 RepID=UPI00300A5D8B